MDGTRLIVSLACAAACAAGGAASAGVAPGTLVRALPPAGGGSSEERSDPASGPGSYASDLEGTPFAGRAFAQLQWQEGAMSFTGLADGGADATIRSQGVVMLDFAGATTITVSWAMSSAVGSGVDIGWGLVTAAGGGEPDMGVRFEETTATAFGGVAAVADGSFAGIVGAGTYLLVILAEATASAGQFGMTAQFTPVPTPASFAILAVFGACLPMQRGRRRPIILIPAPR